MPSGSIIGGWADRPLGSAGADMRAKWARLFRLKLSLKATMLLVLVVGIVLGRRIDRANQQRDAIAAVKEHGGRVHYRDEYFPGTLELRGGGYTWGPSLPWLHRLLGDDYFRKVAGVELDNSIGVFAAPGPSLTDEVLVRVARLPASGACWCRGTPSPRAGWSRSGRCAA